MVLQLSENSFKDSTFTASQYLYLLHIIYITYLKVKLMKLVTVLLPEAYLEGLDELVRANMYPSRSAAIRSAVRDLLKKELWERRGR